MAMSPAQHDDISDTTNVEVKSGVTNRGFSAKKAGHVIWISLLMQKNLTIGWNQLCVFPDGYKPKITINTGADNNTDGTYILSKIDTDGTFSVYSFISDVKVISLSICYFDF